MLHRAREQFLGTGEVHQDLVTAIRPEILTSWRRSRLSGASFGVDALPQGAEVSGDSPLRRAAEPVLAQLAQQLSGLRAGVLLADRHARILGRWAPQTDILAMMDRVASNTGSSGSEELIGTNGIGTVVEDRRPHLITGAEHYADMLSSFTCVGAPIFNPLSRKFEGVVTMNCDASEASPLLTSLIASTAKEVESRLLDLSSRRERALLDAFLLASRAGRAIAVISDDVLLAGTQAAPSLRSLDEGTVWELIRDDAAKREGARVLVVPTVDGRAATLTYTPIMLDGKIIGALVEAFDSIDLDRPTAADVATEFRQVRPSMTTERLPGRSRVWQTTLARALEQCESRVPLLIVGEPGTGKSELVSAMFHGRTTEVVDCSAVAATDTAWAASVGATLPPDGVLVLRHAAALPPGVADALSARLDTSAAATPSPRIVATAHPSPGREADGVQHLLDRVSVVTLEVPPLRDRPEDIPLLIQQLNERHSGLTPLRFSPAAMRALCRAPWPGNIRQLENVIRGIAATGRVREVTPNLLPDLLGTYATSRTLTMMEQLEMNAILETVTATRGNKVEMAKMLGISRSTLYRKMRYFRIDVDRAA
jgi:transcriptional regulator of acetoin/glycerol metabolism